MFGVEVGERALLIFAAEQRFVLFGQVKVVRHESHPHGLPFVGVDEMFLAVGTKGSQHARGRYVVLVRSDGEDRLVHQGGQHLENIPTDEEILAADDFSRRCCERIREDRYSAGEYSFAFREEVPA